MSRSENRSVTPLHPSVGGSPSAALAVTLSAVIGLWNLAGAPAARGRDILRPGGGAASPVPAAGNNRPHGPAAAAQLRAAGQDRLSRATQAIQAVQKMQAAARTAGLRGPNHLGFDPSRPGVRLPNVPNGLRPGGLQVAPGVPVDLKNPQAGEDRGLWVGAKLPKQTVSGGQTTVTIKQTQQQALLNWQTFNVGKETTVRFDQSAGGSSASKWVAFNKIKDPTGVPSQILGSIEAPGQVYLINPNGIIFGGTSQINLRTLVASSLPINDNLVSRGLLNNPDAQFLFSGLAMPAGAVTPAFTPEPSSRPDGRYGDVVVQKGAQINSATSEDNVGGRVALIGANVKNEGSISTPDGQTILAAGLQVGFAPHPSSDPSLRGLDVYIGAVANPPAGEPPVEQPAYAGKAVNAGLIDAPRANVTVAGKDVRQAGVINSTTSVALNGRIDLLADYNAVGNLESNGSNISSTGGVRTLNPFLFLPRSTGTVTLAKNGVTQILPELSNPDTVVGADLALKSQVNVQGRAISMGDGAVIIAPSGNVAVSAGTWNFVAGSNQRTNFVYSGGQIYLDPGATIDVAGSIRVTVPISQNILAVELRGAEFADAPLQREGIFRGLTINVDIRQLGIYNGRVWIGTPLADATGYLGLIERSVGELTTPGGTVKLTAGNSVVMQRGSVIDVSGGWIDYDGGTVQTSRVVAGGRVMDISQATPDMVYGGFYVGKYSSTSAKHGVTTTFSHPLALNGAHYEEGYRFGAPGGTVSISAPAMALDGELLGQTFSGPRQRAVPAAASTLSLAFLAQELAQPFPNISPTPPTIVFSGSSNARPAEPFALDAAGNPIPLRADRRDQVVLSPDLLGANGFGVLKVDNTDGNVIVPMGVSLDAPAGGSIAIKGANITIDGSVSAPAGLLSFEVFNVSQATRNAIAAAENKETPEADPTRGFFTLGGTGSISTAGLLVDDRRGAAAAGELPFLTNGGAITIAGYDLTLAQGSTIDVSGGIAIGATNRRTYGNGGKISIGAGQDLNIKSVLGGDLTLGSTLIGYSGATGSALSILAPSIQIGGSSSSASTLLLAPDFFNQGGFASFSLTGLGEAANLEGSYVAGVRIVNGITIAPEVQSAVAVTSSDRSGVTMIPVLKPEGLRTPVSLSFGATGVTDQFVNTIVLSRGDVVLEKGAVIQAGPRGSVSLSGNTALVLGSVFAPGGAITIAGRNSTALEQLNNSGTALVNVQIGGQSVLSTAGTTVLLPDGRGNRVGTVLGGGTINISGNILAQSGSILDVSGAAGVLDMAPAFSTFLGAPTGPMFGWNITSSLRGAPVMATPVATSGGAIALAGDQALFTDATLIGKAGGASAIGGTLSVLSGRFVSLTAGEPLTPLDVTLEVKQSGGTIPSGSSTASRSWIGRAVRSGSEVVEGRGYLAVDSFASGGFSSLDLRGTVEFAGAVSISMPGSLRVADAGVLYATAPVTLSAAHVGIGSTFRAPLSPLDPKSPFTVGNAPFNFAPTHGKGQLTIAGDLIDIGNLSLQDIGRANFLASGGDIRGNGTLNVAGDIFMLAGQVYTPTATQFTISASDYTVGEAINEGSVQFAGSGIRSLPLSAGGTLSVYASNIVQASVLRAPLGTINLGWNGEGPAPLDPITGAAVAVTKQLKLGAGSLTSVSAVDPVTGQQVVIPFGINRNGTTWIDPTGTDITAGNLAGKAVNVSALNVDSRGGSRIDIGGGGDLYAFRWVQGVGGSSDVLAADGSFAVIPGYGAEYAPFGAFNTGTNAANLNGDPGYVNGNLGIGDRVYLAGGHGLPAGVYTLLPARYALLPGGYLVTPRGGAPAGTLALPDGSGLVPGYRFAGGTSSPAAQPLTGWFEVGSPQVVRSRAEYQDYSANTYLAERANDLGITPPRLPIDSGRLLLEATQSLALRGRVNAQAPVGGRGGPVDISSPVDILIGGPRTSAVDGTLVLNAAELSRFGAESLLIGGVRQFGANGTTVTITTGNLTVDNAGTKLSGPEIILVAKQNLTLADRAEIVQSGFLSGSADRLVFGSSTLAGSGDGTMLRVSSDADATSVRFGLSGSANPSLVAGAGINLTGASVTLDSTAGATLDDTARLNGSTVTLNSGRISIELDEAGTLQSNPGLVLGGQALAGLQSASALNLLSYSSIDIYGTGRLGATGTLSLSSAEIRGFNNAGGTATVSARQISLDNRASGTVPGAVAGTAGTLAFDANRIRLGANNVRIDQFATVELNATGGLLVSGSGGLASQGAISITAPLITGSRAADHTIQAGGALTISAASETSPISVRSGLGASLELVGSSVAANGDIRLPSGELSLRATAGDLTVGSRLDVSGSAQTFHDLVRYTGGGRINLAADNGSVRIDAGGTVSVSAEVASAGSLSISAPKGTVELDGNLRGEGGSNGQNGSFSVDVGTIGGGSIAGFNATLDNGAFNQARSFRVRNGDVLIDGVANARQFRLSADRGSITVTGTIDASGETGGTIDLSASGSLILATGSRLTVAAERFDSAGKGGAISLGAGAAINGAASSAALLDIRSGSIIQLGVASNNATSEQQGQLSGTLHLRAPQNSASTDLQIATIGGTISGASSIVAEGFKVFDVTSTSGAITAAVQASVKANGESFLGAAGSTTASYTAMVNRLLGSQEQLASVFSVQTGAELINRSGNLTLGTTSSTPTSDWNLAGFRFGPKNTPGTLTMRAAGDLVFFNALSDGFTSSAYDSTLLDYNPLLAANAQSWSYHLTAGADLSSADFRAVLPISSLAGTSGSLLLGKNYGTNVFLPSGTSAQTRAAVQSRFQVIRTGSGSIDIAAGRDVQLLNQFATIYTAGTKVMNPTVLPGGSFDLPILDANGGEIALGSVQQNPGYTPQYSYAGGNITINAQADIAHYTRNTAGNLIADSSRQLPTNWLYRRGYIDPATGQFGVARFGDVASTTWWVDYSNFFEGVGTLGGGNITLVAGRDISNVDAVAPTNARMPKGTPNSDNLVELGGGDITVRAGRDIDGGVYYVERGAGTLTAGGSIKTNATRSPSRGAIVSPVETFAPATWLPTTLFAGRATFDLSASGDLLVGPVANSFLTPGGYNNTFWYKSYFSTYSPESAVNVTSLGGNVTFRLAATLPTSGPGATTLILQAWLQNVSVFRTNPQSVSFYQPWLRLNESSVAPFGTMVSLLPPTLTATSFSNNINIVGDMTLFPASRGTLELAAGGSVLGLLPNGVSSVEGGTAVTWGTSRIIVSDADPNRMPGVASPFAYQTIAGTIASQARQTSNEFLFNLDRLFAETGSTFGSSGVLQVKQALHSPSLLHSGDDEPLRIYAERGDITGFTVFSPKQGKIIAGRDITDSALYLQNVGESDISIVAAGRDIIPFNANAANRLTAQSDGNLLNIRDEAALAGDIQISGPGTLEVLAGRNLDLGVSPINPDGTGAGITSIGNARNPALPAEGASIVAAAGIGPALSLGGSNLDFEKLIDLAFETGLAETYLGELARDGVAVASEAEFRRLPVAERNALALELFFLALRDAGREQGTIGNYDSGFAAIEALFPGTNWVGDISLTSRQIKTSAGGDVSLLVPGGELIVGFDAAGEQSADQGILTEAGGNISIFADGSVTVGTSRIFTLRGGDEIIWSSNGDIAAGSAAKTVQSAPPTRVIIDPQTGDVATDLAGLATGGGIGVLATVKNVPPGDVDLIAPRGAIDAGDAGIRVSGNLRVAATQVLNASNIQVVGGSQGVSTAPTVAAPTIGGLSTASTANAATNSAASSTANQARTQPVAGESDVPSLVTVEVIGYGGGDGDASGAPSDEEEEEKRRKRDAQENAPVGNASIQPAAPVNQS
jgi:filamentous hemagglutinin